MTITRSYESKQIPRHAHGLGENLEGEVDLNRLLLPPEKG